MSHQKTLPENIQIDNVDGISISSRWKTLRQASFEIIGFIFYLYELHRFFTVDHAVSFENSSLIVYGLRLVTLLLALPLLYAFRISKFFDAEDAFAFFLASICKLENSSQEFIQVEMFYYLLYGILAFFAFIDILDYIGALTS